MCGVSANMKTYSPFNERYAKYLIFIISLAQERKLVSMVLWLVTTCFVCWVPVIIVGILQSTPEFNAYPSPFLHATAYLSLHLSVVFNPILNLYFRRDIRNTIKKSCLKRHGRGYWRSDVPV